MSSGILTENSLIWRWPQVHNVLAVTCSWSVWNWEFWLHPVNAHHVAKCVYCYDGYNAGPGIPLMEQQHYALMYSN